MIFFNFLDCKKMCFCIFINVKKWDIFQNFYSLCADSISGSSRKVQVDSNTWLGLNFCSTSTRAESSSVKSNGFSNNLEAPVLGGLGRWMSGLRKSSSLKHSKKEKKVFYCIVSVSGEENNGKEDKKKSWNRTKMKKKKKSWNSGPILLSYLLTDALPDEIWWYLNSLCHFHVQYSPMDHWKRRIWRKIYRIRKCCCCWCKHVGLL